jgi:uncharacterized membrane protein YphA (DoxX/SURF4 family)
MFPNGWPGRGLFLLRIIAATVLIHDGIAALTGAPQLGSVKVQVIAASEGVFLLVGLWVPITGALLTFSELWIALSGTGDLRSALLLAAVGTALAMLGPGSVSVDALLFGRRHLDIGER